MKIISIILLSLTLFSCASSLNQKGIVIGEVDQDVNFRLVGSYGQEENLTNILSGETNIPIENMTIPAEIFFNRSGVSSDLDLEIGRVGGTLDVEVIGSGIQNGKSYEVKTNKEHILVGEYESQINE